MTIDEKDLFWSNELNKHDHKRFEVEVINTVKLKLIEKLGNDFWNLKPSFQSYVPRPDGHRALIDLTFDGLEIGLEVDEGQHNNNFDSDYQREIDIYEQMKMLGKDNFTIRRVDVTKGFKIKHDNINAFVNEVVERFQTYPKLVWDDKPGLVAYKSGDFIKFKDKFPFITKSDLFNTLLQECRWGKSSGHGASVIEPIYNNYGLFPSKGWLQNTNPEKELAKKYPNQKFYVRRENGWNYKDKTKRCWYNQYSKDFKTIDMYTNEFNYTNETTEDYEVQHIFIRKGDTVIYAGTYKMIGAYPTDKTFYSKTFKQDVQMSTYLRLVRVDNKFQIA